MELEKAKQVISDIRTGKLKPHKKGYKQNLEELVHDLPDIEDFANSLVTAIQEQGVEVKGKDVKDYDVTLTLKVKRG